MTLADLGATVASFPQEVRESSGRLIFTLAATIISHVFGKDWYAAHVIQDEEGSHPQGFFRLDFSSDEKREIKTFRIVDLAETLFNLQYVQGFYGRVDQMRAGQFESTYAEFDFARFLYIHDVAFRFVTPTGIKGQDYDFGITYKDGRYACADAKCRLEETAIRAETIRNPLEEARKNNLPKDQPGIIFLKVPQAWLAIPATRSGIVNVTKDFLRQTKRIVSVVVYASVLEILPNEKKIWNRHLFEEFPNPKHRFDNAKNWLLFKGFEVPPEWRGMPPKWIRVFSHG